MTRKLFTFALALLTAASARAYDFKSGDLCYNITDEAARTVEVTYEYQWDSNNYSSLPGVVSIPETVSYNGTTYSVTSIGNYAFYGCSALTQVTIPESVNSIGESAFSDCSKLTKIVIPNNVKSIESQTFFRCSALAEASIGNSVTSIGERAFGGCSALTQVTWNAINCADFTSSNYSPFDSRSNITTFTFGSQVEHIPAYLCYGMDKLTQVNIPDGVESIGGGAFAGCPTLTQVTIGDGVTSIGSYAFDGCSALTQVNIPDGVTSIGDYAFAYCSALTQVTIPGSVESIGYAAFALCSALKQVNIGDGVTSIGDYAFAYCSALTQVTIPGSVESIGYAAFALCSALAEINVLATVPPTITAYTFSNINPQVKVSIPEGSKEAYMADENWKWLLDLSAGQLSGTCGDNLTWTFTTADSTLTISGTGDMYDYSYDYSSDRPWYNFRQGIKNISIQDGVESIGSYAFYSCSSLTKVTIGNSVESIGDYAFDYCSALAEITVLPTVPPTITANTFSNINPQVKVSIPEGSKDAYMADENWKQLLDLSAGELSGICGDNLTWTFTTADSTLTISGTGNMYDYYSSNQPWYNFRQGIKNISIQDGVESIGNYAFYSCSSLTKVTIGNSVKSIGYEAFALCSALKQVNIGDGVTSIGSSAFYGCSALTQVTIPGSVTSIGDEAFYGCSALTQVTWNAINCADFSNGPFNDSRSNIKVFIFGNQVEHIPAFLCYGMDKLTQVNIPDGVTSIGGGAFLRCSALTQVNIPDGVTSIENLTFQECLALTQINIPDGVTSIGDQAFCYCSALTQVTISDGVESIGDQAFYGCSALTQVTIPDGVTSIGESAYLDCSALTQVNIPDGVESIGEYAFSRCSALTQVNIGDGVTSIGDYAFAYCSALTQVTIGNSVTSIGNWAFSNCSALAEMTVLATVPPTVESSAFYEVSRDIPVYVPAEALEDYRVASVWREFNLQAMQTALQTPSMPESIRVYGGMLHNPQGLPVSIYDMQGRMVYSGTAATVSQPAGVYVVLCAGASSKVLF